MQSEILNIITANILKLRYELNLSQEQFASKLNLTRQQIERIENKRNKKIDIELLSNISKTFNVQITSFFITNSIQSQNGK